MYVCMWEGDDRERNDQELLKSEIQTILYHLASSWYSFSCKKVELAAFRVFDQGPVVRN